METKEIVISVLNSAIAFYAEDGGKVFSGDYVIDYNPETFKVASFIDRHPGWIKLYVTLEEGTGCFFICSKYTSLGTKVFIAWECDDTPRDLLDCYRKKYSRKVLGDLFIPNLRKAKTELEGIIASGLL